MRQITFLMTFLMISLTGLSQELVTNGDFESAPDGSWFGNAFNIVTQGSNQLNEAEVTTAGDAFSVNLSQEIVLQDGLTYELNFDAFTDATTGSRTIITGLGKNGGDFAALTQTAALTSTSQTFTYQFTINYGDAVNDRVLFDMGAETGFVFIDNVSVVEVTTTCNNGVQDGDETGVDCGGSICPPCTNPPTSSAPTPPGRPAGSTVSVYGDAYGTPIGLSNVPWDDPSEFVEETHAGGDVLKMEYSNGDFIGSSLDTQTDVSAMTYFHLDVWISDGFQDGQVMNLKLSNHNPAGSGGETNAFEYSFLVESSDVQNWVSIDVPVSDWTNVETQTGFSDLEYLTEFLITTAGTIGVTYVDNFYFHQNTLGVDDFDSNQFSAYPNPTLDKWNVKASNSNIQNVEIYNTLGRLVKEVSVNSDEANIDASDLSTGIYFAKIYDTNGQFNTVKLIKK